MATEIERKYLVVGEDWRAAPAVEYRQGYLSEHPPVVRVRTMGDRAALTIKGATSGVSRTEFEYEIPLEDAQALLEMAVGPLIEKTRRTIDFAGRTWEVDEFFGLNAGLVVAEVEIESEDAVIELPPWVGREVSDDHRYFNNRLAKHPFTSWTENDPVG